MVSTGASTPESFGFRNPETTPLSFPTNPATAPIRRRQACPCCRQVSKLAPVITKADAVFSPSEVLVYEPELTPVEGVKDMRNQEGLCPIKRYACS